MCARPIASKNLHSTHPLTAYEETPYIRVEVTSVTYHGGEHIDGKPRPVKLPFRRTAQVCTEGCAAVFARWASYELLCDSEVRGSLCPGHAHAEITWEDTTR